MIIISVYYNILLTKVIAKIFPNMENSYNKVRQGNNHKQSDRP